MRIGITGKQTIVVDKAKTAEMLGSGDLPVFGTPALIALMEETCLKSISQFLEEGTSTVGTLLNVKHVSATPIGLEVKCESELVEIDRKRLVFNVKAYDKSGIIGEGIHERFIINKEKFMTKVKEKLS